MTSSIDPSVIAGVRVDLLSGMSQREIAVKHGISTGSVSNIKLASAAPNAPATPQEVPADEERREQNGDELTITIPTTSVEIQTLEQLVEHCKIDLKEWFVDRWIANKWSIGAKDAAGNIITRPLFQVKAYLKRKKSLYDARLELNALKEDAKAEAPEPAPVKRRAGKKTGNILEISLPDAHLGKLAWSVETGGGNYDTRIAERVYMDALRKVIERSPQVSYDRIVYVVGNDLLQSDDSEGRTTSGTQVDCDGRYHKTFRVVRNMVVQSIELLRKIAPVQVVMVSGNHDSLSVWHLGDSLECYFHRYRDVEIDNAPRMRKYLQHGEVMLMWTHGHKGKLKDYPMLIATEQPAMFGATKFREIHLGHRHKLEVDEQYGVRTRTLPSLCEPDAWHAENGFVGNLMSAEAFAWNDREGLIGTAVYTRVN